MQALWSQKTLAKSTTTTDTFNVLYFGSKNIVGQTETNRKKYSCHQYE